MTSSRTSKATSSSSAPAASTQAPSPKAHLRDIVVRGAKTHNLKNLDLTIPGGQLTVITGLSGSGKSSLAFDTLYAEGQRRYVESLSSYARQFLQIMEKPDVDSIDGLSPAISIEQKATSHNPRSTVGTVTEIHDYLRLLFARCGDVHCPEHHIQLSSQSVSQMVDHALELPEGERVMILAPIVRERKGEFQDLFRELSGLGFTKVRVDGETLDLSTVEKLDKKRKHDIDLIIDRLAIGEAQRQRLAESFEVALRHAQSQVLLVETASEREHLFSSKFACPVCSWSLPELEPRLFSFNSPIGACGECEGLGSVSFFDPARMVDDPARSLAQGAISGWGRSNGYYFGLLTDLAAHFKQSMDTPWKDLPQAFKDTVMNGAGSTRIHFGGPSRFNPQGGRTTTFEGVASNYKRRFSETTSASQREEWSKFINTQCCPACEGSRLRPAARAVKFSGHGMGELNAMSIERLRPALDAAGQASQGHRREVAHKILKEIGERLRFLDDVGLGYLSLSRSAETLSGGEAQRIRLASQIGSGLTGVMYVLDEPSIGLHQRDNDRLLATMKRLRDLGNTVIVVEHDRDAIMAADYVFDIGPGAGAHGGEIVAQGKPAEILSNPASLTGDYLSGRKSIHAPQSRRKPGKEWIELLGCTGNNLKNVDLRIPVGLLTCVCGISGSGKSTLVNDTLYKAIAQRLHGSHATPFPHRELKGSELVDKVIDVDQSPIGRTPRSNPATYTGLFTHIRDLFAQSKTSKERGYEAGRFSFNVKGGRCETCQGDGVIQVEMHFLPDMYVPCETCQGKRYNRETLEVLHKGRSIADVLGMTVAEAVDFFAAQPAIHRKLQTLASVGLGYIKLGQSATTLSGGEAQRVKLALELSKRDTGRTLYILDEPTTGLHFQDIDMLLRVLHKLADQGNTVVVIEHNLDVVKTADWIVDVGPSGGEKGGCIVAQGSPEKVAATDCPTGPYLAPLLAEDAERAAREPRAPSPAQKSPTKALSKAKAPKAAAAKKSSPSKPTPAPARPKLAKKSS
jgi:excinuclease ABC subunit A